MDVTFLGIKDLDITFLDINALDPYCMLLFRALRLQILFFEHISSASLLDVTFLGIKDPDITFLDI